MASMLPSRFSLSFKPTILPLSNHMNNVHHIHTSSHHNHHSHRTRRTTETNKHHINHHSQSKPITKKQRLLAFASPALRLGSHLNARFNCRRRDFSTHPNNDQPLKSSSKSHHHSHDEKSSNKSTQTNISTLSARPRRFAWFTRSSLYAATASLLAVVCTLILDRSADDVQNWQLAVMKTLPLRFLSRVWGMIHNIDLPVWMREPVYMAWTVAFGCILDECEHPLNHHKNLASFFTRTLKAGARPIDAAADIVSPADAEITVFGEVTPEGRLDQIKGMSYELKEFLGFAPPLAAPLISPTSTSAQGSKMYFAVLYLAPGDYHRFHSSSNWCITNRAHFAGQLFPVKPSLATFVPSLFTRNERIVLSGHWKHGFYSYTAVGAYNVGSMKLEFDEDLTTNLGSAKLARGRAGEAETREYSPFIHASKGDEVGRFELGSTVVLVWEVKDGDFVFTFDEKNRKIKVGQPIGVVKQRGAANVEHTEKLVDEHHATLIADTK